MIPPSAVKNFLARPLNDFRWLKTASHTRLDDLLDQEGVVGWKGLMLHQKACIYLGILNQHFGFWCDMGSGKTLIALELMQYWWTQNEMRRALVFVTSDKAFPTWERQIKEYQIDIPYISLDANSSEGKWAQLSDFKEGIILLHYPGTLAMVSEAVPMQGKKKKKWMLNGALVRSLLLDVDVLVLDESTKVANHRSLTFELCKAAATQAKYRYALAGMPFGRDPSLLWPQMKLIDDGETLGPTFGLFREAFFTKKANYFGGPYSFDYTFKKSMTETLSRMLQNRSITYTADECIDLPTVKHITEEVVLPRENLQYYKQAIADLIAAKRNMRAVSNAFLRMRQISSGFLGIKDDESGDTAQVVFDENPKLERLLELIEELPSGRKAVVFYEYTYSGRRIVDALNELGLKPIWLWSGTKEPRTALGRFIDDPECTVAVVNNRVGAYSLDGLQVANYEFHYESAVSVIDRSQAEKRIIRQGQQRTCFIYDLVAHRTVDDTILAFHQEGNDLFKALLSDPQATLGMV